MSRITLTETQLSQFHRDGYLVLPGLLDADESRLLSAVARRDSRIAQQATARNDASGSQTVLAVRNDLGDDYYSAIARSARVVETMERLLGEEVYHYHHKLMLKEPRVGGAWEWHQDYGYWYSFGCLFPRMGSCYVAIDRADQQNGCLQIIPGSHHLGRLDHGKVGGQTGADPDRVAAVLERMPLEYVVMQPGDGLFFHANLLHRSDANRSENPRWSLICCYNTRSNSPYQLARHNAYKPLEILPDEQLRQRGQEHLERLEATTV